MIDNPNPFQSYCHKYDMETTIHRRITIHECLLNWSTYHKRQIATFNAKDNHLRIYFNEEASNSSSKSTVKKCQTFLHACKKLINMYLESPTITLNQVIFINFFRSCSHLAMYDAFQWHQLSWLPSSYVSTHMWSSTLEVYHMWHT
jgi:hypothetical protein